MCIETCLEGMSVRQSVNGLTITVLFMKPISEGVRVFADNVEIKEREWQEKSL